MKTVILCGGRGTRLREETEIRPKPMVAIGDKPVLWHIMKYYSHFGFNDFVLCLGYKGEQIKNYFINYDWLSNDCVLSLKDKSTRVLKFNHDLEEWRITFAETGPDTPTGGRVKKIEKYIDGDEKEFLLTYGDGLSNVDLNALIAHHRRMNRTATLTAVHPMSPFGIITVENGGATSFKEKPRLPGLINGGFFVMNREFFKYLKEDSVLEEEPLRTVCHENRLAVHEHDGFWMCMDTIKDVERLNEMWAKNDRPWVVWDEQS